MASLDDLDHIFWGIDRDTFSTSIRHVWQN